MPRLRRLSGAELVRIFRGFGFAVHSQRGSHMKLRRTVGVELGGGQALHLGRCKRTDLVGREQPQRGGGEAAELAGGQRIHLGRGEGLDVVGAQRSELRSREQ